MKRNECDCQTCQSYCRHVPGWFLPHEAEGAAALLGLTPKEFFEQHLTVDFWASDTAFVLRPRTTREPGGEVAGIDPRGQCTFFKDGRCGIHAAKPHECAVVRHDIEGDIALHKATADAWRGKPQKQIAKLLGYKPEEPEPSTFDIIGLMGRLR